jgi:hypothetical protein
LSALVVKGAWSSQSTLPSSSGAAPSRVTSLVFVLATPEQAQTLLNVSRTWYPRYCEILGKQQKGYGVLLSLTRHRVPRVADQQVDFRSVFAVPGQHSWGDFILLRKGSVYGLLEFARPNKTFPDAFEDAIIKKFAARLHM